MSSFRNQIKAYFNFNRQHERGAFVLIGLIILVFAIDLLLPIIIKEKHYDFSSAMAEIDAWKASATKVKNENRILNVSVDIDSKTDKTVKLNPVIFNPNNLSKKKWIEMGLPKSVVNTIKKYESKGGSFKAAEDIQKIYGLTSDMYNQLKDFIQIPIKEAFKKIIEYPVDSVYVKPKLSIILDINRVDSIALLQISGIGPFYAGQIVKYRNQLGGYNSIEQLKELYKMDSIRLQKWLPYLSMKDSSLRQIDINSADFKTVLKHPYLDYETTKRLFNLRNKLGRFAGLYQLKNDSILSDSLFQILEPYLKVD